MFSDAIIAAMVIGLLHYTGIPEKPFSKHEGLLWTKLIVLYAVGVDDTINGVVFGNHALSAKPLSLGI